MDQSSQLSTSSKITTSHEQQFQNEVRNLLPRNYFLNGIEGGIYIGGLAFVSSTLVLPLMVKELHGPTWAISLMPTLQIVGFMISPIFTIGWVSQLHYMKPFVTLTGFFQRLPLLIAGILMVYGSTYAPQAVLTIAILAPLISGIIGGLSFSAWMELVSRIIPPHRRASCWALRSFCTMMIGLLAGQVVHFVLAHFHGYQAFGILYIIAASFTFLSYLFFLLIREPVTLPIPSQEKKTIQSPLELFLETPWLLKTHPYYTRFLMSRIVGSGVFFMLPLFSIFAVQHQRSGNEYLGTLIIWQMMGGLGGNILAAWLGDQIGGKILLIMSRMLYCVGLLPLFFSQTAGILNWSSFLIGFVTVMDQIGDKTLEIELIPPTNRLILVTLGNMIMAPTLLLASFGNTLIVSLQGKCYPVSLDPFFPALGVSMLFLACSAGILSGIPEPRKSSTIF